MNLYSQAESNNRKTWFYLFFFLLFIIGIGWIISYFLQSPVILYFAVILSMAMSLFSYWHSDKIVLALSRAKPIEKQDNPELYRLVENLCITAGLPLPKIYIIDSAQPNAFAAGRDAKHAVVAVTRGLLEKLERVELEGVIAHELSHIGNKDMLLQTIIVVLVGMVVIMTDFFFRIAFWGRMGGRSREGGQIRLIMILIALILAILAPIFAQLIKLAISRKREYLADSSAAFLTRYPEGLAQALEKISADSNPLKTANDATSHLYIASPFRGKEKTSWLHKLFMTHPPIGERIKALREMRI
ncbi:MAG: zinc metalloprotease HtpX [Candidatus Nealsonbacteria bacterium CG02_land_8_20_14_3_00_37_10]|uniref:Protease HtpX homolog n=2 Tax=Candidatus Nealsoniibacteriota TaxID=1817911 RepID=A0A2G9YZ83_9BACT|nr:MAG: zinc metalloprotease HtpX [Candidatus Nealsonbacteria bacterium CG23_combo_of_CG06-09_8_20_14_all_37_18]PIV45307.1 MAG: zinc metalloprotease HtpX [Candidatus Nealsonbacteria bacterium CG02_land_8_20_14_3_00_37_10]